MTVTGSFTFTNSPTTMILGGVASIELEDGTFAAPGPKSMNYSLRGLGSSLR